MSQGGRDVVQQTHNVRDEPLNQHFTDRLPDDDPQNLDFTQVRGEFVVGHNPALGA